MRKSYDTALDMAIKYYTIISILNNLKLTKRQTELVAFMAIRGNISSGGKKDEFCNLVDTTKATVGNLVYRLKKKNVLIEKDRKIIVNPLIALDFNNNLCIQINLESDEGTAAKG